MSTLNRLRPSLWLSMGTIVSILVLAWPREEARARSYLARSSSEGSTQPYPHDPVLRFEPNLGQTDAPVRFLSRGRGYTLFLNDTEAVLSLREPSSVLRMRFVGANEHATVEGRNRLPGQSHYFGGKDLGRWLTGVPNYAKVEYENVYPGVDLVFYGNGGELEHDFIVRPGASPDAIRLGLEGVESLAIDDAGNLLLRTTGGELRLEKPYVYQTRDGIRKEVAGSFVLRNEREVGFHVPSYEADLPLVVDPVLVYSTYLGGSSTDVGHGVAVDDDGNGYATGSTWSLDFPTTPGALQPSAGGSDVFVTKLDPAGAVVYSTYIGGSSADGGRDVSVDADGSAYVTGNTSSSDFPVVNAFQPSLQPSSPAGDAFVFKLSPDGGALVYSSYLGGTGLDGAVAIAVDTSGIAHVAGVTEAHDFPTVNALQPTYGGGDEDAFVTKVDATGSTLLTSTYLGGSAADTTTGLDVDSAGQTYVTGFTRSDDFPVFQAMQPDRLGEPPFDRDAFVTKIDSGGTAFVYSTYLGGSFTDLARDVAADDEGNAYVAGDTASPDFPTTPGAVQPSQGDADMFVAKLDAAGSSLSYSTFLGTGTSSANAVAVDASGSAFVVGETSATDFPLQDPIQPSPGGGGDAFAVRLDATGSSLAFSTYLGGSGEDRAVDAVLDGSGNALVVGWTKSEDFPTQNAEQASHGGGPDEWDVFVAKIGASSQAPFGGAPFAVPGEFPAEDFDRGGEGVAYHDAVPGNAGGFYRTNEDVDIIATSGNASGHVVNNFETGEWLEYTIDVETSGTYRIDLHVSSQFTTSRFHVEVDGEDVTGTVPVPDTGWWGTFEWVGTGGVLLEAGQHVLRVQADEEYFNLDAVAVATDDSDDGQSPFFGSPFAVPGELQAEDFDLGGEGVAYHDEVAGNAGGQYRPDEDVDIIAAAGNASGHVINNIQSGEWLEYTIEAATSGTYRIELHVSSQFTTSRYHVEIDGVDVTGPVYVHDTGGWGAFEWRTGLSFPLDAGRHVLRIHADEEYFNLDAVRLLREPDDPPAAVITSPPDGATVSGTITVTAETSGEVVSVRLNDESSSPGPLTLGEDTTEPYAFDLDTTTYANGDYAFSVMATDGSGRSQSSAIVRLTFANDNVTARIEETDPRVEYISTWIHGDTSREWSGGTASLPREGIARFRFNGGGSRVAWIGARGPEGGIARIWLGSAAFPQQFLLAEVDTYAPQAEDPVELFATAELRSADWTLDIDPIDRANPDATDTLVAVDAFDVRVGSDGTEDGVPPTVAITSPADGATVSGTVVIAAEASDDVEMAGVQFFKREPSGSFPPYGAIGPEVVTPPYSVEWDTTREVGGTHTLRAVARDAYGNTAEVEIAVTVDNNRPDQSPFGGAPFSIPGRFEAEDFDLGGEGVAYHDAVPGNAGGAYRTDEDVDIITASGNATGHVVNNIQTGEWLEHTIDVATSGTYRIDLHVSSQFTTSGFHVEVDGTDVTGSVSVPDTGWWGTFQWVGVGGVTLAAGEQVLRIHADEEYFNLDAVEISPMP